MIFYRVLGLLKNWKKYHNTIKHQRIQIYRKNFGSSNYFRNHDEKNVARHNALGRCGARVRTCAVMKLLLKFEDYVIKKILTHIVFSFISLHYLKVITARDVISNRLIRENPVNDYSPFLLAFKQFITIIETMQLFIFKS